MMASGPCLWGINRKSNSIHIKMDQCKVIKFLNLLRYFELKLQNCYNVSHSQSRSTTSPNVMFCMPLQQPAGRSGTKWINYHKYMKTSFFINHKTFPSIFFKFSAKYTKSIRVHTEGGWNIQSQLARVSLLHPGP